MESRDKDSGWNLEWGLLVIAALGACALAVAYRDGWSPSGPDTNAAAKLGQMGDFFGGMLNPLVSALTLFVAISVWQLQKKELKATQKALKEQAKTAEQQRQEQRFFDLLNVYQRTVDSIVMVARDPGTSDGLVSYSGKEAIAHFFRCRPGDFFGGHATPPRIQPHPELLEATNLNIANGWCQHNDVVSRLFDHYFRVIQHILFEAEALLGDQHIRYIKLFRAQLSRSELIILSFNLWLDDEGKKMLPLAEKYSLLEHLPTGHLRTELENLHPKVFGHQPEASL